MGTDNIFQGWTNQSQASPYQNSNVNWNGQPTPTIQNQQPYYSTGYVNRTTPPTQQSSNIPVRVVFSPEQITPQEIPTNGQPALFPLSDGSKIIAKYLAGNGLFGELVYVLQPTNYNENVQQKPSEFDQVMARLGGIEDSLNRVISDLYGSKSQTANQEGAVSNE